MADGSIVDALRDLYISCGGDISNLSDNHNATDYIRDLKYIITAAQELPVVQKSDNGKVLSVVNGVWNKADVPTELPYISPYSDNGKVLMANNGVWAKSELPTELPSVNSEDDGSILKVVDGQWQKGQISQDDEIAITFNFYGSLQCSVISQTPFDDVYAAFNSGKRVVAIIQDFTNVSAFKELKNCKIKAVSVSDGNFTGSKSIVFSCPFYSADSSSGFSICSLSWLKSGNSAVAKKFDLT